MTRSAQILLFIAWGIATGLALKLVLSMYYAPMISGVVNAADLGDTISVCDEGVFERHCLVLKAEHRVTCGLGDCSLTPAEIE